MSRFPVAVPLADKFAGYTIRHGDSLPSSGEIGAGFSATAVANCP